jgi:hypothetical protein
VVLVVLGHEDGGGGSSGDFILSFFSTNSLV